MRIGLVADVPDDAVSRGVEHVVQGRGQLDHAQARAQVSAGDRHRVDGGGAQLVGGLAQLAFRQPPQVGRRSYAVQQRCRFSHKGLDEPDAAGDA